MTMAKLSLSIIIIQNWEYKQSPEKSWFFLWKMFKSRLFSPYKRWFICEVGNKNWKDNCHVSRRYTTRESAFSFSLKVSFYPLTMANFPITSHTSPLSGLVLLSDQFTNFPFYKFWSDTGCPSRNVHNFFKHDTSRIFSDKTIAMEPMVTINKKTRQDNHLSFP